MKVVQTRLVLDAIGLESLIAEITRREAGAIATFLGVVRAEKNAAGNELIALEYTAYEQMASAELDRLASAIAWEFDLLAVRAVHRLGTLGIGEASVAVVVSSAHRAAAFDACRALMERIKADVPIFKREIWSDGPATWVNPL